MWRLQQLGPFVVDFVRLCVWLLLLMAIFVPLERRFGIRRQRVWRNSFVTDLGYYFLSSLAPKLLLVLPVSIVAWGLHSVAPVGLYATAASLPIWARFGLALVVGEFGAYWGHRWSHEIPLLWRFHSIHHSSEEIDWLVNTRAHPVDLVFTRFCAFLPMYILGLAQPMGNTFDLVPVLVTIAGTMWGFFIHANLNWRLGPVEWLLSSPAFHHWHHANEGPESVNKNYSAMLPWLDRCFGTFHLPAREFPQKYGIDAPIAPGLPAQLLRPFVR